MVSKKKQILDEISKAEDCIMSAELLSEAYPFVQDLLRDISETILEVKMVVKGADEIMPKGQTTITDSLIEPELIGYKLGSFKGE